MFSKCQFVQDELHYLSHVMGKYVVKVDLATIKTIVKWETSHGVGQLCSFMRLCNSFKRFIQGYPILVTRLTNLIWHDSKYSWIVQCQKAFDKVKYALTHVFMLVLPNSTEHSEVIYNASIVSIIAFF